MNKFIAIVVFLSFAINGCKSIKPHMTSGNRADFFKLKQNIGEEQPSYTWFKAKAELQYTDKNTKQNAILHLVMKRDSLIWGSVTATLGVEAYRFYMTVDSIFLIDKINKIYYVVPVTALNSLINANLLNYRLIEKILFGRSIFEITDSFKMNRENEDVFLYSREKNVQKKIFIDPGLRKIKGYEISDLASGQKIQLSYKDKISSGGHNIPKIVDIRVTTTRDFSLVLKFLNLQFNKPVDINTIIPKSYERVP
jgi:hypothetical protein